MNTYFAYPTGLFDTNWTLKARYNKLIDSKVIGPKDAKNPKIDIKCTNCDLGLK